jgi:hypothetical protein
MTLSEGQTAEPATAENDLPSVDIGNPERVPARSHDGLRWAEPSSAHGTQPVFSDLIDRWLREGERLQESAGAPEAGHPGDSPTQVDGWQENRQEQWKARARELVGLAFGRHRLEVLVGIGMIPLALFLLVAGHAAPQAAATRAVAAPTPAVAARPAPPRPLALLSEPPVTVLAPRPAAPAPAVSHSERKNVHPAKHATTPKRAPARSHQALARASRPVPSTPSPITRAPMPPRPVIAVVPNVQPPARPAPKVVAKAAFAVDPRIAPNLKLGGPRRQ